MSFINDSSSISDYSFIINAIGDFVLKLIVPILVTVLAIIINDIRLNYLRIKETNRYINILRTKFSHIEAYFDIIEQFRRVNQVSSLSALVLGSIMGLFIGILSFIIAAFSFAFFENIEQRVANNFYGIWRDFNQYIFLLSHIQNVLVLFSLIVYRIYNKLIVAKHFFSKNAIECYGLKKSQVRFYLSFWFFVGIIFAVYLCIIFLIYILYTNETNLPEYALISKTIGDVLKGPYLEPTNFALIQIIPWKTRFFLTFYLITSSIALISSLYCLVDLFKKIKRFPKDVIEPIKYYHQCNFPYVKIKTDLMDVKGQLKDIDNKHGVTLSEENLLSIVSWEKIEMMEVSKSSEDQEIVLRFLINNK